LETARLDSKDAKLDRKHYLPSGVMIPPKSNKHIVNICFCDACRCMVTEWEISRYGCCPRCRGHRFRGGWETPLESLKLKLWVWTNNWRVTGKWRKSGEEV
jgi:hypothetical protein